MSQRNERRLHLDSAVVRFLDTVMVQAEEREQQRNRIWRRSSGTPGLLSNMDGQAIEPSEGAASDHASGSRAPQTAQQRILAAAEMRVAYREQLWQRWEHEHAGSGSDSEYESVDVARSDAGTANWIPAAVGRGGVGDDLASSTAGALEAGAFVPGRRSTYVYEGKHDPDHAVEADSSVDLPSSRQEQAQSLWQREWERGTERQEQSEKENERARGREWEREKQREWERGREWESEKQRESSGIKREPEIASYERADPRFYHPVIPEPTPNEAPERPHREGRFTDPVHRNVEGSPTSGMNDIGQEQCSDGGRRSNGPNGFSQGPDRVESDRVNGGARIEANEITSHLQHPSSSPVQHNSSAIQVNAPVTRLEFELQPVSIARSGLMGSLTHGIKSDSRPSEASVEEEIVFKQGLAAADVAYPPSQLPLAPHDEVETQKSPAGASSPRRMGAFTSLAGSVDDGESRRLWIEAREQKYASLTSADSRERITEAGRDAADGVNSRKRNTEAGWDVVEEQSQAQSRLSVPLVQEHRELAASMQAQGRQSSSLVQEHREPAASMPSQGRLSSPLLQERRESAASMPSQGRLSSPLLQERPEPAASIPSQAQFSDIRHRPPEGAPVEFTGSHTSPSPTISDKWSEPASTLADPPSPSAASSAQRTHDSDRGGAHSLDRRVGSTTEADTSLRDAIARILREDAWRHGLRLEE